MRRSVLVVVLMASVLAAAPAFSKGTSSSGHSHSGHSHSGTTHHSASASHSHSEHHSNQAAGVPRDSKGHIKRSSRAKHDFEHSHPCPSTAKTSGACPGYVVDDVKPLKRGGADKPENMQWQTVEAAKAKDEIE